MRLVRVLVVWLFVFAGSLLSPHIVTAAEEAELGVYESLTVTKELLPRGYTLLDNPDRLGLPANPFEPTGELLKAFCTKYGLDEAWLKRLRVSYLCRTEDRYKRLMYWVAELAPSPDAASRLEQLYDDAFSVLLFVRDDVVVGISVEYDAEPRAVGELATKLQAVLYGSEGGPREGLENLKLVSVDADDVPPSLVPKPLDYLSLMSGIVSNPGLLTEQGLRQLAQMCNIDRDNLAWAYMCALQAGDDPVSAVGFVAVETVGAPIAEELDEALRAGQEGVSETIRFENLLIVFTSGPSPEEASGMTALKKLIEDRLAAVTDRAKG